MRAGLFLILSEGEALLLLILLSVGRGVAGQLEKTHGRVPAHGGASCFRLRREAQGHARPRRTQFLLFLIREDGHSPELAVKAGVAGYLPCPDAAHGLAERLGEPGDFIKRKAVQDPELAAEGSEGFAELLLYLLCRGGCTVNFRKDSGKGKNGVHLRLFLKMGFFLPVSQIPDSVHDAYGERLSAHGADIAVLFGFFRRHDHVAVSVPVVMILALLRVDFERSLKVCVRVSLIPGKAGGRFAERGEHAVVADPAREEISLPAEVGTRVRVRIGHEGVAVEGAHEAVHAGIRRESRLQGENMLREAAEAVVDVVKAGFGTEQGKPRGPHMRGNEEGAGAGIEHEIQKIR